MIWGRYERYLVPIIYNMPFATNLCHKLCPQVSNVNNGHFRIHYSVVFPLIIIYGLLWLKWKITSSLLKLTATIKLFSSILNLNVSIPIIIFIIIPYWKHYLKFIIMIPNIKLHAQCMIILSAHNFARIHNKIFI